MLALFLASALLMRISGPPGSTDVADGISDADQSARAILALRRGSAQRILPLDSTQGLVLLGTRAEAVTYQGRPCLRLTEIPGSKQENALAIIQGARFTDGVIEVDVAGAAAGGAPAVARGFVGIAFRAAADGSRFEYIYLRPGNGRADDQLRRNHSTQYASEPDYPWYRLRKESPGVYESYVDLELGAWTHLRIVVDGTNASLYVNGAAQPYLIVHDLKLGAADGGVGLWIGLGTVAHFANLRISN